MMSLFGSKIIHKHILSLLFIGLVTWESYGQNFAVDLVKMDKKDLNTYAKHFFKPFASAFMDGLNNGWYNTGKPHKKLGIDFTISVVTIKPSATTFKFVSSEYNNLKLQEGPEDLPTIFQKSSTSKLSLKSIGTITETGSGKKLEIPVSSGSFQAPSGISLNDIPSKSVPVPTYQLGIGLIKKTELRLSIIPNIKLGKNASLSKYGFGVMHSLSQWIPVLNKIPFLDVSFFGAYSQFNVNYSQNDREENIGDYKFSANSSRMSFMANTTTLQLIGSVNFSILTVYVAPGYNIANSRLRFKGNFTVENTSLASSKVVIRDPVDVTYNNNSFRLTTGVRIKLAVLTLHADYTLQKHNSFTVGIGFSFR